MTFIRFYFIQSCLFVNLALHLDPLDSIYITPTIYYNNIMLDIFPLSDADLTDTLFRELALLSSSIKVIL